MQAYKQIADLRQAVHIQKQHKSTIGLVPTMGNLHEGHLALVQEAKQHCDFVICSLFVNPLQFGANEDLNAYPRTLDADIAKLKGCEVDCLFHPTAQEIYPHGIKSQTIVSVPGLGMEHCGKSRPGHFDGVTTVVSKLFNICLPDQAFFGLKDYQQYLVICAMVQDLHFPIKITGVETHRESSGLAMSSRNNYLSDEQRQQAPLLYQTLVNTANQLKAGNRDFRTLEKSAKQTLTDATIKPDYFSICSATTLQPAKQTDPEIVILGAILLGKTRLIDNIRIRLS